MTNRPRIYITGASCAGVTTLGATLARQLGLPHIDVDQFYWLPTDPPFSLKRPPQERVSLIRDALGEDGWILAGSFDGWGDALIKHASLIVFVVTPHAVRMDRLRKREKQRYGERIAPGGDMYEAHIAFAEWASQYESPGPGHTGRNLARHENWLAQQSLPVLRLDGTDHPDRLAAQVVSALPGHELH
ncbi:adenylate kinase [Methylobacillus flagellatus]|uniref:ATP-binding protein n=1 Tax=Methylobacillus flagellatus TaxID=405 RepID=UPI0028538819|nr:adenylate kinase [Methylobacillus flagellatus]MDR5172052.1 adenylate kinase [Methylobacillus flagellatus]